MFDKTKDGIHTAAMNVNIVIKPEGQSVELKMTTMRIISPTLHVENIEKMDATTRDLIALMQLRDVVNEAVRAVERQMSHMIQWPVVF